MPYLPTPNAFLEQSSLLLEAYPDNTRITTKYSYPSSSSIQNKNSNKVSKSTADQTTTATYATLTLKTYNPVTGICLKYKTNKAAEVGRLISGLGKLAAGVKITADEPGVAAAAGGGDVEMSDVQQQPVQTQSQTVASGGGGGGGGKKKKGKGKK